MKEYAQKQFEDLIEAEDLSLKLVDIESIPQNENVRERLEKQYGADLYSEILLVLTHERFETEEAKLIWKNINAHLDILTNKLDRNPGITVATLDYLSNIHNYLSTPVLIAKEKSNFISETTTKDGLTQLYLREVFDVILEKEFEKKARTQESLTLLMLDIDDFKQINDHYGHTEGDVVLRNIGELINNNIRAMDLAARYGGEEFAIIAPESTLDDVLLLAERIRNKISLLKFSRFSITVSIGISQTSPDIKTTIDLINAADEALYAAKQHGKNRVTVHKGGMINAKGA